MTALTPLIAAGTFRLRRASGGLLFRLGLRKRWPQPEDIDAMSVPEREAYFNSLHIWETSDAAVAEWRAERSRSSVAPDTRD